MWVPEPGGLYGHYVEETYPKCAIMKAGVRLVRAATPSVVENTVGSISWDYRMQQYSDKYLFFSSHLSMKCSFNPPFLKCA